MSAVWLVLPSKRLPEEVFPVLKLWEKQGYDMLVQRDPGDPHIPFPTIERPYVSYAESVNFLVRAVFERDPGASWIVTGGDDTEPDLTKTAFEIGQECWEHFQGTFGVMQPIGDMWECRIDTICGSPWMGKDFCLRINQGQGPQWPEYFHMFGDQEMQEVTKKLGILWQRPDLSHKHHHYLREGKPRPAFHARAASQSNRDHMSHLFQTRKAKGFPGHEPLLRKVNCQEHEPAQR